MIKEASLPQFHSLLFAPGQWGHSPFEQADEVDQVVVLHQNVYMVGKDTPGIQDGTSRLSQGLQKFDALLA